MDSSELDKTYLGLRCPSGTFMNMESSINCKNQSRKYVLDLPAAARLSRINHFGGRLTSVGNFLLASVYFMLAAYETPVGEKRSLLI